MSLTLDFGKYTGKTLEWIFFNDPGYIWWIYREKVYLKFSSPLQKHFKTLIRRALHLKIPGLCPWCKKRPITRMFLTKHISGGLACVDFDCDQCKYDGGSESIPTKPSFFTPDFYRDYDKTGGKIMIEAIKFAYFGNSSTRMTQKRLEEFFNNPENFINY